MAHANSGLQRFAPVLLVASTMAQYEGFEGYRGHPSYHKEPLQHQVLDEHHGEEYEMDYHAHPKYSFDYSVKDPHTGDDKEHWETRDGDKVKGSYTILEHDGTKRVVEYEADDKNGFNAVVHKIGTPKHEETHEYLARPAHEPVTYHGRPAHEPVTYHARPAHESHEPVTYHGRPAHELAYQHDYGRYDDGFVPIVGSYGH